MLKKLILKTAMYGVVMFGLSTYAGYLMTGHLPSYVPNFRNLLPSGQAQSAAQPNWSNIGALEHKSTADAGNYEVVQGGKTTIYKWKDANGHWQYGERAPTSGAATKIEVATAPAANTPADGKSAQASEQAKPSSQPEMINPYSPEGVKQLMDKAHDVQRMMNQHNEQLGKE